MDYSTFSKSEIEIFELFDYKCLLCPHPAVTLHEIIPKSRTKDWERKGNRVPLCSECHTEVHRIGASVSRPKLEQERDRYLNARITC